jgi:hemoglobin-like flavoprotein
MQGAFTSEEITQLRASFLRFIPASDAVASNLYRRLFEAHPEVESLFISDHERQKDKLIHTIAVMIDSLDKVGDFYSKGVALGDRHRGYGVTDEMYVHLKDYLVAALQDEVDPPMSREELELWGRLYDHIARTMTTQ